MQRQTLLTRNCFKKTAICTFKKNVPEAEITQTGTFFTKKEKTA